MKGITWGERMIDTDKYEGHTPAEHWSFSLWGFSMPTGFDADAQLIADAPLLLEEVKRLREQLGLAYEFVVNGFIEPVAIQFDNYVRGVGEEG